MTGPRIPPSDIIRRLAPQLPVEDVADLIAAEQDGWDSQVRHWSSLPPGEVERRVDALRRHVKARGLRNRPLRTCRLPDGTVGYYMRRRNCWQAAVATVLQIPVDECPAEPPALHLRDRVRDPTRIHDAGDQVWAEWFAARNLTVGFHAEPVGSPRWVGILPPRSRRDLWVHCLVMCRGEVLFDPAPYIPELAAGSTAPRQSEGLSDLLLGVTFEPATPPEG